MQFFDGHAVLSATDLSSFVHCGHLRELRHHEALGKIQRPIFDDPATDALSRRGEEHEKAYLAALKAEGRSVVELSEPATRGIGKLEEHTAATLEAMRRGVDVIHQGALFDGTWFGKTDFLMRVEEPSDLGAFSYEVVDAKLAREAKATAVLQILLYTELLTKAQGRAPVRAGLALAGPNARTEYFRVADYEAYYRSVRRRFDHATSLPVATLAIAPDPVAHCGICAWSARCKEERHAVDHLSLVAGITRKHMAVLRNDGVTTLAQLAQLDVPGASATEITSATFERIQNQARVQLEGRVTGRNIHELLQPIIENQGLSGLPAPSEGDLYFDLESDNNAFVHGIEYLFGYSDRHGGYQAIWALNPEQEKAAFERFVDDVVARKHRYPDMHIYHYSAHEITALTTMMSRYGTREDEVDDLLRGEVFVDLLRVVKQSLRASVESYSIKKMEPFYGYGRAVDLQDASRALARFEMWLEFGDEDYDVEEMKEAIRGYNRDDCDSMLYLQNWLEKLRDDLIAAGTAVPRPAQGSRLRTEEQRAEDAALVALRERLLEAVPVERDQRDNEQQARWLLGNLLGFHNREDKSYWWSYFDRLDKNADECEEDGEAIGNMEFVGMVAQPPTPTGRARAAAARFRYPPQEHGFKEGTTAKRKGSNGEAETVGTVAAVDELNHTIDLRLKVPDDRPVLIVPHDWINPEPIPTSIFNMALAVAEDGLVDADPYASAMQLLLRAKPRLVGGAQLKQSDENIVDAGRRLAVQLDRTVLPIQGPPGAGKTYLGARMILSAVAAGKRVGITAPSHAVICNLLDELFRAADEENVTVRACQKTGQDSIECERAEKADKASKVIELMEDGCSVVAGTAWLWASELMQSSVDILFIDEGGQFSLANALAVAPAASSMVILGDPQQLDQPRKGVHPEGCDVSALDHLLGGEQTIAEDRGLFMDQTWRLHPDICAFTSQIFYNDRLQSRDNLHHQAVTGGALNGSGLRLVMIPHTDHQNESIEEARAIAVLLEQLMQSTWVDKNAAAASIALKDVVIVAPYNAQVDRIRKELQDGARVGTVDKFQGQEAAVAIYSLASSSALEAPRGMKFLYSPNRFNVATSRGRCLAIVVASPQIFAPECKTPEQMRYANAFCRYQELATIVAVGNTDAPSRYGSAPLRDRGSQDENVEQSPVEIVDLPAGDGG